MIKVGFQGICGSNSEIAAENLTQKMGLSNVEFVGLVTSKAVIEALEKGLIDYGVLATKNSIGGEVKESMTALQNKHFELVAAEVMPIHHCIFKKNKDIDNASIRKVASHEQALKQTEVWVKDNLPSISEKIYMEDTAISAVKLQDGTLDDHTAIICSLRAGQNAGLAIIAQNIEDNKQNRTEFRLLKNPAPEFVVKESLSDGLIKESSIVDKVVQGVFILVIIASITAMNFFNLSPFEVACTVSGYVAMLFVLGTNIHRRLINKTFIGYWKYYTIPLESKNDIQHYHIPRIVEIKEVDGKLKLCGYSTAKNKTGINFVSDKIYTQKTDSTHGILAYEYSSSVRALDLGGLVFMNWYKKHSYAQVKRMEGQYFGVKSREMGTLVYQRISPEEFQNISNCEFLDC